MSWRQVGSVLDAIRHSQARTIDAVKTEELGWCGEVWFTDGTAVRVEAEEGTEYSEHTIDPAYVVISIWEPDPVPNAIESAIAG